MSDTHSHRGDRLEEPPKGYRTGFSKLIWNLREYGYPITEESVKYVLEYLESQDISAEDTNYQIVAQWVSQHKDVEFETNNNAGEKQVTFQELF